MQTRATVAGVFLLGVAMATLLLACGAQGEGDGATPGPTLSPAGLLERRCSGCHGLDRIVSARKTEAEWQRTVERMRGKGAHLSEEESAALVRYLGETYK